jgi:hypothetical protein
MAGNGQFCPLPFFRRLNARFQFVRARLVVASLPVIDSSIANLLLQSGRLLLAHCQHSCLHILDYVNPSFPKQKKAATAKAAACLYKAR